MDYSESEINWALQHLGLHSGSEEELLKYLQREDCVLEYSDDVAFKVLTGCEADQEFLRQINLDRHKSEIYSFSNKYFDIPVEERKTIHSQFLTATKNLPELLPRLKELEQGLNLNKLPDSGPVASFIMDLYPLPLNERAEKFNELINMSDEDRIIFKKDYRRLKRTHRKYYDLCIPLNNLLRKAKLNEKHTGFWIIWTIAAVVMINLINVCVDSEPDPEQVLNEVIKQQKKKPAIKRNNTVNKVLEIISKHKDSNGNTDWESAEKELKEKGLMKKITEEALEKMNSDKSGR